ncbi:NAD-dependent protein deacetylase [Lysobacter helvus]|uniref:NAD-dependent protein deacetylase n=2 Tax=Lysobacteraceae TaxID=32033 RepID=A0ABN6FWL9_9GAMM|nr:MULTISPECIES: NAD-dependent protein deacetylase [Lysobacter]BCT94122.1 NAD-dependent protein deacetylase [Lysobacter caseinilyticus]BCT97278.1 NAD-dependent protein deacetylase [Lysobacter helvus]
MPDARALADWLHAHPRVFVLTGAGCSTASGIPDYRDRDGGWKRKPPVTYQAFVQDPATRARYWARSHAGWPMVARAQPNAAHRALADLEACGRTTMLVTQNVDGLHQRAGTRDVLDLHGRIDAVRCLGCGARTSRDAVQAQLVERNPDWSHAVDDAAIAPDGDAELDAIDTRDFQAPRCDACDGLLKPDVVFFGENVPRERVFAAQAALQSADAMLVAGSSLMVYSGYRFALLAREAGLPLAILTNGTTRADALATLKLEADCGNTLETAVSALA